MESNEYICRFCKNPLKYTFVDLGSSPLANAYLDIHQLNRAEQYYPFNVYVCESCLLVQLPELVTAEEIFLDYAYFSSFSDSWLAHAESYVQMMIERFGANPNRQVIEIASNDGYLLKFFKARNIPVLGIEPAKNVAEAATSAGIPTLTKFFGIKTAQELVLQNKLADILIGNNVLAHVPDLNDFVEGMKIVLKPEGIITMEFPHLMRLMEENQFDTIYHEHFSYFSFLTVNNIFNFHKLKIFDIDQIDTHGGSLRIYAAHMEDQSKTISQQVTKLIATEKSLGFNRLEHHLLFGEKVKEIKRNILSFLIKVKNKGKSILGYGAPAKGNTLLNYCGIRKDFIEYTVDRNPHKQNHYLPGSRIPIYHPDKLKEDKPDYLIILPWNLKDEIMEQMACIRDWGGQFVTLVPEVRVYS